MDYHYLLYLEKVNKTLLKQNYNLKISYQIYAFVYLLSFFLYQTNLIKQGGTTWDDLMLLKTSPRIIEKFQLYFLDSSNPFLSEFSSNFEFYGYLVLIPAYLFSKNNYILSVFSDFFQIYSINSLDLEYMLRHIFLNIYVVISLYISFRLYSKISNQIKGLLFIILITLVPLFSGHSLFNLKDIPFLFQNLFVVLVLLDYLKNFEKVDKFSLVKIGTFCGLLLLIRLNGIAFIFIYFLFSFLYLNKTIYIIRKNFINWFYIFTISILLLFLGTPSAWQKPKYWIEETIATQFNIYWDSYVLMNGNFFFAMDINRTYLFISSIYKMPLIFSLSMILGFYLFVKNHKKALKNFEIIFIFSLFFIIFIHLSFIILKPVAYDGIRQYLFLIPFYCSLTIESIALIKLSVLKNIGITFLIALYLVLTQYGLGPYKYVYLNEFASEEQITIDCEKIGGCGDWQTDYWGYSGKKLVKNLNSSNINGQIYFCTPKHVFSSYLNNKNLNIVRDIESLKNKNIYIAYIHRPMLKNDTCGINNLNIKLECDNVFTETTSLRGTEVSLSYVDLCSIN